MLNPSAPTQTGWVWEMPEQVKAGGTREHHLVASRDRPATVNRPLYTLDFSKIKLQLFFYCFSFMLI